MKKETTITIEVVNGLLEFYNIPEEIKIIVKDYDVEGISKKDLKKDEAGYYYFITEYCHKDNCQPRC